MVLPSASVTGRPVQTWRTDRVDARPQSASGREGAVDITQVILDDHEEQRRMFARLDDVDRSDTETLGALWTRLSTMLEVHAQA